MSHPEQPDSEYDDILDNVPDIDGEDEYLYGDRKPPDHDPGRGSGCLTMFLVFLLPPLIMSYSGWYLW